MNIADAVRIIALLGTLTVGIAIYSASASQPPPPLQKVGSRILVIILEDGKKTTAGSAEASFSKSLSDAGWEAVSADELTPPKGSPPELAKEALRGGQPSALELARLTGVPYILIGRIALGESKVSPMGVSLTMMTAELSAKVFSSTDGALVKAIHLTDRSSAPEPLVARSDVHEKIANSVVETTLPLLGKNARKNPPPIRKGEEKIVAPDFGLPPSDKNIAVVIGIENYRTLPASEHSRKDAEYVTAYLASLGFPRRNIEFISDERATKTDIEKVIEGWLPNVVKPDSVVLVYYSGHGAPDPTTGDAYLVPFDGDPNYLGLTGYPLNRLYEKLAQLPARQIVVLLDSCFSGSGGRSVLAKGVRSLVRKPKVEPEQGKLLVMTSSQGAQISTSVPDKGHGAFTYYFLQALREGKRDVGEIYGYLAPLVSDEAKRQNVEQTPFINWSPEQARGKFLLGGGTNR